MTRVPYIPMLREDNARQGSSSTPISNVVASLSEPVNEIARFGYLTGWRKGEILPLRWDRLTDAARGGYEHPRTDKAE